MQQSWAEYKKTPLHPEMTDEEKERRLNNPWPSVERKEVSWNDGSNWPSSPVIPSATTAE